MLNYDHQKSTSNLKFMKEKKLKQLSGNAGFGSKTIRFIDNDNLSPCVGTYSLSSDSPLLKVSPSLSNRGYISSLVSRAPQIQPFKDYGVPGPSDYNPSKSFADIDSTRPTTSFMASGNGRVPFPSPNPYPGPSDYYVNFDPGNSPIILNKSSSNFASRSKRSSIYVDRPYIPPVGNYNLEKEILSPKRDVQWSRYIYCVFVY
jgi:hypothetical protein